MMSSIIFDAKYRCGRVSVSMGVRELDVVYR